MLTYNNWQDEQQPIFSKDDADKGARQVLQWSYDTYKEDIVYACSFGIEGIVLIDLIAQVHPTAHIIFLDTDLHFQETYDTIERVKARYPTLRIESKKPKLTLEQQAQQFGDKLWERDPNACCNIRKIEPLNEALNGATAWISGLRREQSESRKNTNFLNQDNRFKSIKVCPLIHWTWKDVWRYVTKHNLTYNVLHDQGYPSIGCSHCTKPAFNIDDLRAGRWQGSGKTECGLHT